MKKISKQQSGFTIIELLVATTIFSIVLVVIVASFLQVGRMFYKGVSINNTNEAARNLVDDIANDVRLSKSSLYADPAPDSADSSKKFFCVGQHRYTYKLNTQVRDNDINPTSGNISARTMSAGVVQDSTGGNCQDPSHLNGTNASQVLGPDMRLNALDVAKNATGSAVRIHAHILFYGTDDNVFSSIAHPADNDTDHAASLSDPKAFCSGNLLSTQFCSVADIDTNIALGF
jgi:prepilin-type N-terminal cleavage/methylation domain-containing protein